ncbi:hypothetical protein F4553_008071 [Allocatelliglobosispora scoriae]|uniref:AbiJ-NTD3 domain-containing protein n=1 Tax=Allocatelliglobosispora scoriae TaxID=643052 RepID=A0A841BZP0_9ACTN|nr:hypothetical protein [Allocatelliglobosispora scoriae]MBB5874637.1 hypothetical protein [Allocatelliglobosispora scoriae]
MAAPVKLSRLRAEIAGALSANVKSYDLPGVCRRYGLTTHDSDETRQSAFRSKSVFVNLLTSELDLAQLLTLAHRIVEDYEVPDLEELLDANGVGVTGEFKNLIFGANGPKPQIIFRDAINNDIEVVRNAQYCLIFDRPLGPQGLTWSELVSWWMAFHGRGEAADLKPAARTLYKRLAESLDSPPERLLFKAYCALYETHGFHIPALIPQVYLHYDPYVRRDLMFSGDIGRQRMDFLLLLPGRVRVVLEVDGVQHYARPDGQANPQLYSEMVAEDRNLRLAGYELYRFGGYELSPAAGGAEMLTKFFQALLQRHNAISGGVL